MKNALPVNGNLIGIMGGIILSSDSVFIRMMGIENSWLIVALRGIFMWGMCLLVWLLWRKSRSTLGTPWLTQENALSTLFFCISSACFVNALNRGSVATVLVIISSTPFISALISRLFFKMSIDRSVLLASLAGILGVAVVMSGRGVGHSGIANLYALGTAFSMALAFIFTSRVSGGTAGLPSLGAILASVVIVLWSGSDLLESLKMLTPAQYGWSIAEGALIMPLAMGLITLSTRFVSPANAGLFLLLETALAPLWMYLFLDEIPTIHAVIGGAIIILAVVSQTVYARRRVDVQRYADAG
ncbi:EamA family transporter [Erwinia sp. S43]|uniref:DMT family transporter n=1 Tax=unclassified Erwinia TaxID=2622719 RepID=UPI00190B864C|nr:MULTISPECIES: DMT family transporter [unclassified Erwinia]MBK0032147.1 EamA family transporter [Erwinia sp. S43]MCW1876059.1 DMT family transporter [Erwinia sp. INIA01]